MGLKNQISKLNFLHFPHIFPVTKQEKRKKKKEKNSSFDRLNTKIKFQIRYPVNPKFLAIPNHHNQLIYLHAKLNKDQELEQGLAWARAFDLKYRSVKVQFLCNIPQRWWLRPPKMLGVHLIYSLLLLLPFRFEREREGNCERELKGSVVLFYLFIFLGGLIFYLGKKKIDCWRYEWLEE